jgi:hypothetical protein
MPPTRKGSAIPRFEVGDKVRVRQCVREPDFPDIPLGGWSGTIEMVEQIEDRIDYEIEWNRKTLAAMHPVYRKRCERDGLEPELMWLGEADLEPDDGTPAPIEQPTSIVTKPLSEKDQDDRVRMALGLTHDDPLPEINFEALLAYHRYLAANLRFPFAAYCGEEEVGPFSRRRITMTVTGLLDAVRVLGLEDGLVCTGRLRGDEIEFPLADIEVRMKKKDRNSKLLADYAYWFHNWPCRDEGDTDRDEYGWGDDLEGPLLKPWSLLRTVVSCGIAGGLLGATIGAALRTIQGAGLAAAIGGIPSTMVGAWLLGRYGRLFGVVNRLRYGPILGAASGLVGGGLVGVAAGLTIVSLPWSFVGLLIGMFLGPYVLPQGRRRLISLRAAALGTCGGILVSSFRHDQARAVSGAVPGLITGMIVGAGLLLALIGSLSLFPAWPMESDRTEDGPGEPGGRMRMARMRSCR